MRRLKRLLLIFTCFVLQACSTDPEIVGRWEEIRGPGLESRSPDQVEFRADGTVAPDGYTWRESISGRVIVEMSVPGRPTLEVGVIVLGRDEFTITTQAGEAVFRRVAD